MQYVYGLITVLNKVIILGLLTSTVHAQVIDLSSGAEVEFDAVGKPSMISIKGTGAKTTGKLEIKDGNALGEFILNLNSFTTDMETRDEHMKENYLETKKPGFDKAILKIDQKDIAERVLPVKGKWSPKNLKGHLTLHGVTKEIPLTADLELDEAKAKGKVKFKIKLQDYAIEIPSFAGITVADEVSAEVNINNKVTR